MTLAAFLELFRLINHDELHAKPDNPIAESCMAEHFMSMASRESGASGFRVD